jgi:hypothetical protein
MALLPRDNIVCPLAEDGNEKIKAGRLGTRVERSGRLANISFPEDFTNTVGKDRPLLFYK